METGEERINKKQRRFRTGVRSLCQMINVALSWIVVVLFLLFVYKLINDLDI